MSIPFKTKKSKCIHDLKRDGGCDVYTHDCYCFKSKIDAQEDCPHFQNEDDQEEQC